MKTFKPYTPDQLLLLPPVLQGWLPEGHLARFLSDVVDHALDLTPILVTFETGDGRGQPPYHPALMVKLLLYAYCTGKPSSRQIERAPYEEVPYRVLAANPHPDPDSMAAVRHQQYLALDPLRGRLRRSWLVNGSDSASDPRHRRRSGSKHRGCGAGRRGFGSDHAGRGRGASVCRDSPSGASPRARATQFKYP